MKVFERNTAGNARHQLAQRLASRGVVSVAVADINAGPSNQAQSNSVATIFYNPTENQLDAIFNGTLQGMK